jgi:uncharacterized membrane protein
VVVAFPASLGDTKLTVRGWWTVDPATCKEILEVPLGNVYLYAEGDKIEWNGRDKKICVSQGEFERVSPGQCDDSGLKSFTAFRLDSATFTWDLTN